MANHKRSKPKKQVRNPMDNNQWFGNNAGRFKAKEEDKNKKAKKLLADKVKRFGMH